MASTSNEAVVKNDKEEIYLKQACEFNTVVQSYKDKTEKIAWFDSFKIHLAKSIGSRRALCKQTLKISVDLLAFIKVLETINKEDPNLFETVSQGKNWKGNDFRLVLKRSGTTNPLVYLVHEWAEDVEEDIDFNDDNEEDEANCIPVDSTTYVDKCVWNENFDKWFLAEADETKKFAAKLRSLHTCVCEYNKLHEYFKQQQADAEVRRVMEATPPPPPPEPQKTPTNPQLPPPTVPTKQSYLPIPIPSDVEDGDDE